MTIPTSPSVVVLENDNSIYAPNVESSVVGVVGFADKGPTNEATLITSQNQLLNTFGKPNTNIPGQGLEGALEILETTNQLYFVRAVGAGALESSASVSLGFCPSFYVSSNGAALPASFNVSYTLKDNFGEVSKTGTVTLTSSVSVTSVSDAFLSYFDEDLIGDSPLFASLASNGNVYLAGMHAGASALLTVSSSNSNMVFGPLDQNGNVITALTGVYTSAYGGTAPTTGVSSVMAFFQSIYPGAGYNLSSLRDGSVQGLSIEIENKSFRDEVVVNSQGSQVESFLLETTPSSPQALDYVLNTDISLNESEFVNAQIYASGSGGALFTGIPDNKADTLASARAFTYLGTTYFATPRFVKLVEGTYSFAGGNSGYSITEVGSSDDFTSLIGDSSERTGLYALDDDSLNISLALVPGITAQSVQNALITLAETSKNFIALVAPPYGLDTTQEAVDWMNGKTTSRTAAINSSYAAVYWPWVQVFNYHAGADEWYDPAIFAARQYVYTDNVSEPWFAPAGFRRGRLTKASNTEIILNQGDRDVLYSNNINPISKENQAGIVIFGQRTAQRLPSALNSVNVRRLMILIRKILLVLGRPFQFEPNDVFTWELVEDSIQPFLDDLISRRAIVEGAVKCDSTTNTPIRVDRKELWCSVTIKPTLAAETIVFEVNLTNQAATING